MAAKRKQVEITALEVVKKHLSKMPEKKPDSIGINDALLELKPHIEEALSKGYSRDEIAAELCAKGIEVKPYQIKRILSKAKEE